MCRLLVVVVNVDMVGKMNSFVSSRLWLSDVPKGHELRWNDNGLPYLEK